MRRRASTPAALTRGARQVIRGWDAGVKGMRVGGSRTLRVPAKLGYVVVRNTRVHFLYGAPLAFAHPVTRQGVCIRVCISCMGRR